MKAREVRDFLVPLEDYPIVDSSATLLDAVRRLDDARRNIAAGKQPYQAVLVADASGHIVGKLGQFAILKSLEPQSRVSGDKDALARAGVSEEIMDTALGHFRSLQSGLSEMCIGASGLPVRMIMTPFAEHIDIETPICEVVHKIIEWQTLSVMVTEKDRPVGLVRLADLCDEVMGQMLDADGNAIGED